MRAYVALVAPELVGAEVAAFVAVELERPRHRSAFLQQVMKRDEILECHHVAGGADYLLKVRGMSMRDAGIMDGDLLAVQATKDAKNGQIVVARLGDEVTVKRFRRNKHLIELHAENPDYQTIVVEPGEPFEIEGLAVGLIRNTMLM